MVSLWGAHAARQTNQSLESQALDGGILLLRSCASISPLLALALQPSVSHTELLVAMETERRAGSQVAGLMLNFLELAVGLLRLRDQGPGRHGSVKMLEIVDVLCSRTADASPVSGPLALAAGNAARRPRGPGAPHAGALAAVIGAEQLAVRAAAVVAVHLVVAAGRPDLPQGVHTVTLPQLHTHPVLLQLAWTHTHTHTDAHV